MTRQVLAIESRRKKNTRENLFGGVCT